MTKFHKMQGAGNDYLFFDCFEREMEDPAKVSKKLSQRRFSVGGDGIILVEKSEVGDAKMRIFNADGSEGKMCGNGIRCLARYLYDMKNIKKDTYHIETLAGIRTVYCKIREGQIQKITADMGEPKYLRDVSFFDLAGMCVSMGNLHCVLFVEDVQNAEVDRIGGALQQNELFPDGVNVEFVQVLGESALKMRVYERGSGETFACGTGACAAAYAARERGLFQGGSVLFRGGVLEVSFQDENCYLSGGAEVCFSGEVEI